LSYLAIIIVKQMRHYKKEKVKERYETPTIRHIEVLLEKVIAESNGNGNLQDGGYGDANANENGGEDYFGGGNSGSFQGV
jgi:hypothetical protein